ncbi:MAG: radical SAM protein [Candidatus Moraniibacteriota bacterium]
MSEIIEVLRLSKWVQEYERGGIVALYHTLNIDVVYLCAEMKALVASLRYGTTINHLIATHPQYADEIPELIQDLVEQGMVVRFDEDDEAVFIAKKQRALFPIGIETLYLLLTESCNMRCTYCFILDGMPEDYRLNSMSWETAKVAIDAFFANIWKNPPIYKKSLKSINFFGGEPLINFRLIQKVVEYVEATYAVEMDAAGESFIYSLITNGTMITREMAEYFSEHPRINVTVSIDGMQAVHDQKRVFRNGSGSFDDALRGLHFLKAAGCSKISLSCTVAEHNMDYLDQLLMLHQEFGFLSVNLNPLLDTEQSQVSPEYMLAVNERMISYFMKAREVGVYEDRVMRKIRPFISKRIHAFDCQATGHQLVCSPTGRLGVCHEGVGMSNYFFAQVSSDFDFHGHPVIQEWGRRTPLNMPQCYGCEAIGVCGGGCAYGAHLRHGSIWSVDDRFCGHSLTTLQWIIWDIYSQSQIA